MGVHRAACSAPQEALDGGLVRSVHPADELLPAARALAREIAENTAPVSVALSRQMLWRMLGASHPMEAHRVDSRGILARGASGDAAEGVTSASSRSGRPYFPCGQRRTSRHLPGWSPPNSQAEILFRRNPLKRPDQREPVADRQHDHFDRGVGGDRGR